jgi:hypothetical protein
MIVRNRHGKVTGLKADAYAEFKPTVLLYEVIAQEPAGSKNRVAVPQEHS